MPEQASAQALQAEIARLDKMVLARMDRAERSTSVRGSEFAMRQTAIMLEDQLRARTGRPRNVPSQGGGQVAIPVRRTGLRRRA